MSKLEERFFADIEKIRLFLPHRSPFLLVDRVEEIILPVKSVSSSAIDVNAWRTMSKVGTSVKAKKCVTYNEPFFVGHFPDFAIMPGVLVVEALAQAASFTYYPFVHDDLGTEKARFNCILAGLNKCRFRKPVVPGDVLILKAEVIKNRGEFFVFNAQAEVDGQVVAEAEILANLTPKG